MNSSFNCQENLVISS